MVMIATSEHTGVLDIPHNRIEIGERILANQLRGDPVAIHQAVMQGTVAAYREFGKFSPDIRTPEKLPNFLTHMMQVNMVTASLMDGVRHKPDGSVYTQKEKRELKRKAAIYAGIHDIGRLLDIPDLPNIKASDQHAWNGQFLLSKLLPGPIEYGMGNYARFAKGHHRCGLYMEFAGVSVYETIWRVESDERFKACEEGITDQNEFDKRVYRMQEEVMENHIIPLFDREFGIAGITALIADLSKAYTDLEDHHRPVIDAFTKEKADALLERQITSVGAYDRDSDQYKYDQMGMRFMLKLIAYVQEKYGIDYHKAIEDAKEKWDGYVVKSLNDEWADLIAKPAQEEVA